MVAVCLDKRYLSNSGASWGLWELCGIGDSSRIIHRNARAFRGLNLESYDSDDLMPAQKMHMICSVWAALVGSTYELGNIAT